MSNSVNLSLDVTKTGIQNPLIKVRQGDGGFETLHTTVTSNGEPLDLQGWTITFMGTTAGNHKIVDGNVTIVEAPNGIFDYTPSKAWGIDIGEFKIAYFKFVKGDGSASSANFRVNVIEAVDLTQEEAQNYISVIDTKIAEINQHLTDSLANVTQSIADTNNKANTVSSNVTALGNRVDDYNNKLSAVQIGGRNYILNSKRVLDTKDPSAQHNSDSWWDLNWLDTSIPVSDFSNKVLTISIQADYDNVAVTNSGARIGMEIVANEVKPDGSIQERYINDWRNVKQGDSFHGRFSTTVDLRGVVLASISTPNHWGQGLYINGIADTHVSVSNPKIEISNVATDWTPAPEDADNTFLKKTNQLPVAARDFNYLAQHMQTYQGTWWNGADSVLNAPTDNWTWSIIEVIAGNSEGSGMIRTTQSSVGDVYMTSVDWGTIKGWKLIANDANVVHKTGTETIAGDKTFTSPINGQLSGNAATATKWQTARTLALTGDVTGSVDIDGSGNVSITTTGANLVHKTGAETIDGDKTFAGKVAVSGTLDAAQKIYTRTIGTTNDLQITYTRVGNLVTGRYTAAKSGVFTLSNNDGYKAPTAYPVNVIAQNVNAWFTTDNRFSAPDGASQGNFMFITSDPLPAN